MLRIADSSWAGSASIAHRPSAELGPDLDPLAQRAVEQVDHPADLGVEVDHLGLERLAAGEGEQLAGQGRGAAGGLDDRVGEADPLVLGDPRTAQDVGRALDDGQQIVEIVGDPAGQLAERLHLLGLAQLLLGMGALLDLDLELGIGVAQRLGALLDLALGPAERGLRDSEDEDDQHRHRDEQADEAVAGQPARHRLAHRAEIDAPDPLAAAHRRDEGGDDVPRLSPERAARCGSAPGRRS